MAFSLDEALGMSLADEADESIHVGIDTRQVTIPESQQVFGVESDEDVEVKHIVIDGRYADGTDLSTFTFRVNYQNANGDKGTYLVTELKVNDSSIEFDWIIGRQVVAYKGTIAFIVCAYTIDSSSVIQNEWNSTLGKGIVLEGLEVSEFDFGDDIVRQLASILSDVNAAQASAKASADEAYKSKTEVVALGKEQQAAIEKKGKDALASIPEDYTQVSNDVSQLKEATAKLKDGKISKFYASSQGNTNLPDSDNGKIIDLKLYGKGSQQQYAGRNLWSGENLESYWMGDGETVNSDCVNSDFIPVDGAKTIYVGFSYDWAIGYTCYDSNKNKIDGSSLQINSTTSGTEKAYEIRASANKTPENTAYIKLMYSKHEQKPYVSVAEGAYEPYVGGIPSPNPEYPQEIKSVVNPVVTISDGAGKQQTATLPYTLNAIPVSSGGNVTIDGQPYIADYVDVERGKLVKMVEKAQPKQFDPWGKGLYHTIENGSTSLKAVKCDFLKNNQNLDALFAGTESGISLNGDQKQIVFYFDGVTADKAKKLFEKYAVYYSLATPTETDLTADEIAAFKALVSYYPTTNVSTTSDQLDGYTVFNYPISLAKGYDYLKTQLGDTRDYLYGIDLMTAEAYVNSEYAAALAEIEV